jgi:hypothetical protein
MTLKLSSSAINTYTKCGQAYYYQYDLKERMDLRSLTLYLGHVVEQGVTLILTQHPCVQLGIDAVFRVALINTLNDANPKLLEQAPATSEALLTWCVDESTMLDPKHVSTVNLAASKELPSVLGYAPKVKNLSGVDTKGKLLAEKSLLTNALYQAKETLNALLTATDLDTFLNDIDTIECQSKLEQQLNVGGVEVSFIGYGDYLITRKDGSMLYLDCKYSKFDYKEYRLSSDTQLLLYAIMLKKQYPNASIQYGFLTPRTDCTTVSSMVYWCEASEILTKQNVDRLTQTVQAIASGFRLPSCGGGAYQSISCLCNYKHRCPYSSGKLNKEEAMPID